MHMLRIKLCHYFLTWHPPPKTHTYMQYPRCYQKKYSKYTLSLSRREKKETNID